MRNHEKITIALAGNPNCGKTTLFNLLTKSGEAVGNRAGVTFEPKKARMRRFADSDADIVDLPGCYSLSPYGNEEKVAERYIKSGNYDVIIDIADATNLDRSLYLTLQLIEAGARVVLALNMMDEAEKEEIRIDIPALAEALGTSVNELLSGERLTEAAYREKAEENLVEVLQKSAFSVRERTVYFTKKWNREHRFEMILWAILYLAAGVLAWIFDKSWIAPALGPAAVVIVIWMRNRRSCYVEGKLYGSAPEPVRKKDT